jgi:Uncharacterised nucleotidyltransferase
VARPDSTGKLANLAAAGARLRVDAGTVEVLESFEHAGVRALLLKGPSITSWLYPDGKQRPYVDCDLLVGPANIQAAERVLQSLGYLRQFDERQMPSWWREHANEWQRAIDGLEVDLHRTLVGVRVDDATTWRVLSADTAEVEVAGHPVLALALPARAMHVALHAAQHGPRWPPSIVDLERALAAGDDDLWHVAAGVAAALRATETFVAGLRLVPAGERLVTRLGLADARSVDAELRAGSPPPLALGFEQVARASGTRARAEIVWHKLVPPPAFIRYWDPRAANSRLALARAYVRRPLSLLRRTPRGLQAWHRARRSVRGGGGR